MKIDGKNYHTLWENKTHEPVISVIDQRYLPHNFKIKKLRTVSEIAIAIKDMWVRGAPLIGVTASYGMYLAAYHAPKNKDFTKTIQQSADLLLQTRPTAINLAFAIKQQLKHLKLTGSYESRIKAYLHTAQSLKRTEIQVTYAIGQHGLKLIATLAKGHPERPINILTHCNAGWLACIDWGTATAPIYMAHQKGIKVHVWIDETRPRNQGASLTAFELQEEGIKHTLITDNTGGHLMQHQKVDMVIVGTDRTTSTGDVANKIGTYLKALAAKDNQIPFYVAAPSSSIDWTIKDGIRDIPIEERNPDEVRYITGLYENKTVDVLLTHAQTPACNYSFDVTPARLVTGIITERGYAKPHELYTLFPEKNKLV